MSRRRKLFAIAGASIAVWWIALLVIGAALEDRTAQRVVDRMGASLGATGGYDDADLGLVRGRLVVEDIRLAHDDTLGKLSLTVAAFDCDLLPLGLVLFDRDCGNLAVRGVRFQLSTFALFKLRKPKHKRLAAESMTLTDAVVDLSPSALMPGLGKVRVTVHEATASETTFKTPLSWLLALETMRATLELSGMRIDVTYAHGHMSFAGGVFGMKPIALPVKLPIANAAEDAKAELDRLVAFGKELAKTLLAERAGRWLQGL